MKLYRRDKDKLLEGKKELNQALSRITNGSVVQIVDSVVFHNRYYEVMPYYDQYLRRSLLCLLLVIGVTLLFFACMFGIIMSLSLAAIRSKSIPQKSESTTSFKGGNPGS